MRVTEVLAGGQKEGTGHMGVEKWEELGNGTAYIHVLYVFSKSKRELEEAEKWSDTALPLFYSLSTCPRERLGWEVGISGPTTSCGVSLSPL